MKIVHVCLAGCYTIGWSYQENLLTKYHTKMGYKVTMITSKWIYKDGKTIYKTNKNVELDGDVKVIRLEIKGDKSVSYRFKRYIGLYDSIDLEKPDILFIHGCQFLDIKTICRYLKNKNKVKVYVDNHADFSNSGTNFISKYILHRIIWKKCAHMIEPYVKKFYGVLPSRVEFLASEYKLPREKIELLLMGIDDDLAKNIEDKIDINKDRKKLNINDNDFVIITGGKIDYAKKETLVLMKMINELRNNIKLLVFGSIIDELIDEFNSLLSNQVIYLGWLNQSEMINKLLIADLAIFPGRHSVIWEQACGLGIPIIVKNWKGTHHVDKGGNAFFFNDENDLKMLLEKLINNNDEYANMKNKAVEYKMNFYYSSIANKSINS